LNQLTEDLLRVKNFNVSVKEVGEKILFMRKLKPGGSEHSFGIHVARLAGMPNKIVIRANDILHLLEKDKQHNANRKPVAELKPEFQLSLFEADPRLEKISTLLAATDINTISPVEALLKLNEVIGVLKKSPEGKD
jgi:DNA mismatch repair protein MutS